MKSSLAIMVSCCFFLSCSAVLREMVVKTSVADLRTFDEKSNAVYRVSLVELQKNHQQDSAAYKDAPAIFCRDNPYLVSQLLFGDRVLAEPYKDDWYKVQALEQKILYENTWQSCPGFIRADCLGTQAITYKTCLVVTKPWACLYKNEKKLQHVERLLSLGTCLAGAQKRGAWWIVDTPLGKNVIAAADVVVVEDSVSPDLSLLRDAVVATVKLFLGGPYVWGGGSAWKEHAARFPNNLSEQITGVDCSNLIYLAFKAQGLLVPRNSHSQWLAALPIASVDLLRPGDLIFFADLQQKPRIVNHVVMYGGKNEQREDVILESNGKELPFGVRMVAARHFFRFGKNRYQRLHNKQIIRWVYEGKETKEVIYLGTFFTAEKLAVLRRNFWTIKRGGTRLSF